MNKPVFLLLFFLVNSLTFSQSLVPIYQIQGTDSLSKMIGKKVITAGVVIGDYQEKNQLKGFFIQDLEGDGDPLTSDGIFVYDEIFYTNVSPGDFVEVKGEVAEYRGLTEIKNVELIKVVEKGIKVKPKKITLPIENFLQWEQSEGMLIEFNQELTITDNFDLGKYGEITLSSIGRVFTPPNLNNDIESLLKYQDEIKRSRIVINDGRNEQNIFPLPFWDGLNNSLRVGSKIQNLTGCLSQLNGSYKINATENLEIKFDERPLIPDWNNSNIRIACLNVFNFFNGDGRKGGFPTARGAASYNEFVRQRSKLVETIKQLNPDILGLIEIENDGDGEGSAIKDLVDSLNASLSNGDYYEYIHDPKGENGNPGKDLIKVTCIYKPSVVRPIDKSIADINSIHERPPIAQTFQLMANGEILSVVMAHFKSKVCSRGGIPNQKIEGVGCFNERRIQQAEALIAFIEKVQAKANDEDILCLGDFNAYEMEEPIKILEAGDLVRLIKNNYSYIFQGQSGLLDHAFATSKLAELLSIATTWHINADEPRILDYNTKYNPPDLFSNSPFRSSDHDPILIGLNIKSLSIESKHLLKESLGWSPNPFVSSTTLKFYLEKEEELILKVFNSEGQQVQDTIINTDKGDNVIHLDRIDLVGESAEPGIYFYYIYLKDTNFHFFKSGKLIFSK